MSVFEEIKARVNLTDAAHAYGFTTNRAGFISCPFHREKTPSLKLSANGRWHCFGCGAGGDVIDFTAQLFGLDKMGAVDKLNGDFHLGLDRHRQPNAKEREEIRRRQEVNNVHRQFEAWRSSFINDLNGVCRVAHLALKNMGSWDKLTEQETEAIRRQAQAEYLADTLSHGSGTEQMEIFRCKRGVSTWTEPILKGLPRRSMTA